MGKKYRRYKNAVEKYLASEKGQRFFHVAYSGGAAIVIIGALFKINHYPLGSLFLMIGMLIEAFIFALSAFDRPSKDYKWEEVYPVLANNRSKRTTTESENESGITDNSIAQDAGRVMPMTAGGGGNGTIIIGGGGSGRGNGEVSGSSSGYVSGSNSNGGTSIQGGVIQGGGFVGGGAIISGAVPDGEEVTSASEKYAEQLNKASENMEKFAEITNSLSQVSDQLLTSFKSITDNSDGLGSNTQGYVTQMEALNRNLAGLNTIYEIQLKGVSGQINTIDQINGGLERIKNLYQGSLIDSSIFKNETEKMAQQLAELNRVYARLLQAMTVNMGMNPGGFNPGMPPMTPPQTGDNK